MNQLGKRLGGVSELYTKWVITRATTLGIHYPLQRPLSSIIPAPSSLSSSFETKEEFKEQLLKLTRERDDWQTRCKIAELENETLKGEIEMKDHQLLSQRRLIDEKNLLLQQKDALLMGDTKRRKRNMDMFSGPLSDSKDLSASDV
ncbi:hypothetical protein A2U01_0050859 [Trifolium medium]|uniref:Uncharacterized protein n=1 Tax=Trifolium medium TaxID=97028 RepID=A0A392R1E1_9FABA|nr:hypothetical protein [Trifolium medium]